MNGYVLDLAISYLLGEATPLPPKGVNWAKIFAKAAEQQILSIVYSAVVSLPKEHQPSDELLERARDATIRTSIRYGRYVAHAERLWQRLEEQKINVWILKGAVLKDFYPDATLRTMGDLDVLTTLEGFPSVSAFLEGEGFYLKGDFGAERTYAKEGNLDVELFSDLSHDFCAFYDQAENYLEGSLPYQGREYVRTLSLEWQFVHFFVHLAKHFTKEGCGVRNLFDLYYMLKIFGDAVDFDEVRGKLNGYGLLQFYEVMVATVGKKFGIDTGYDVSEEKMNAIIGYMLSATVYGEMSADADWKVYCRGGRLVTFFYGLFPPLRIMKKRYPGLNKAPYLLPFAWKRRICRLIFLERPRMKKQMKVLMSEEGKRKNDFMRELGLLGFFKRNTKEFRNAN